MTCLTSDSWSEADIPCLNMEDVFVWWALYANEGLFESDLGFDSCLVATQFELHPGRLICRHVLNMRCPILFTEKKMHLGQV